MKNYKILVSVALGAMLLPACNDLDKEYNGGYVTPEQKSDVLERNPEMAQAGIVGITATASSYNTIYAQHFDFGMPACMMMMDFRGMDYPNASSGYDHFTREMALNDGLSSSVTTNMYWNTYYSQIFAANAAAASIADDTDNSELQFYRAQALAIRAYDYLTLIQNYQFTYVGNEDAPGVPIITNENADQAAKDGAPRAKVSEVYAQIKKDIDRAIELLSASGLQPSNVLSLKPKRFVSLATAYGIRARMNLIMNHWGEAAADAHNAILAFSGQPYSIAQATPGLNDQYPFWNIDDANWMWGIAVSETDRVVTSGIVNFPSMMSPLCDNSYFQVGAFRKINKLLYESMGAQDVRRTWFFDANGMAASAAVNEYNTFGADAYTTLKFGPYKNQLGNSVKSQDIPLMRIEEMYLIEAEATGMNGGDGASLLNSFVQTYRDPEYSFAGSGQALQDEVWRQRRIEFWGEGLSQLDILRLKKNIDRQGAGYDVTYTYNITYPDNIMIVPLPDSEMTANKQIGANNPGAGIPSPVTDDEEE